MGVALNKTGGLRCPCGPAGPSAPPGWQAKAGGFWDAVCFAVSEMGPDAEGETERKKAVLQSCRHR